jgi:hypothetical protein
MDDMETRRLEEIEGRILVRVEQEYDERLTLFFYDGSKAIFHHEQDCCELVEIEDVSGDWEALYGHPVIVAEERSSCSEDGFDSRDNSDTWTFYTFRTNGGTVDVRWHGSSNGYYSESVDYVFLEPAVDTKDQ